VPHTNYGARDLQVNKLHKSRRVCGGVDKTGGMDRGRLGGRCGEMHVGGEVDWQYMIRGVSDI